MRSLFAFSFKKRPPSFPKNFLPRMRTKVPGPQSVKLTELLRRFECPQITFVNQSSPVFFKKAAGVNITDVDGNRYVDLTSAFGVSGIGHTAPAVLQAIKEQTKFMIHGMGDVHPNEVKVLLAKRLSEITPGNLNQTIFSSTGAEAVESALKTAVMHTKKTGVVAFTGAYHGLCYGALNATHREDFRKPFEKQLGRFSYFAPFPDARLYEDKASEASLKAVKALVKKARRSAHPVGAVIVEPIQGRGGIVVPPPDFLKELRGLCDEEKILLIADEVFTGFGRTGSLFAVEKSSVVPDLLCLGKGMGGGFPISACIGTMRVMHSWGPSTGDAIHTSTFLGSPLGCAIALAVIKDIEEKRLVDRVRALGDFFKRELYKLKERHSLLVDIRGAGLIIGLELGLPPPPRSGRKPALPWAPATREAKFFIEECLRNGVIVLPSGPFHNTLSVTPPFVISEREIAFCVSVFDKVLKKIGTGLGWPHAV
ncbi:MAG: aspartate aminotransferase family protein [Candidatus Omnitrophica bacterium]|nr:aspartate aminotransferase family protein [Candidatus Omnitrophota bacterium]